MIRKNTALKKFDLPLEERARLLRDPLMRKEVESELAIRQYIFESFELYDVLQEFADVFDNFHEDAVIVASAVIRKYNENIKDFSPGRYIESMLGLIYDISSNAGSYYTPRDNNEMLVVSTASSFMQNFYRKIWDKVSSKNKAMDLSEAEESLARTLSRIDALPQKNPQLSFIGTY